MFHMKWHKGGTSLKGKYRVLLCSPFPVGQSNQPLLLLKHFLLKAKTRGGFITKGFSKVFLPKGFLALFGGQKDS